MSAWSHRLFLVATALLAFVKVEPAPSDLLMMAAIVLSLPGLFGELKRVFIRSSTVEKLAWCSSAGLACIQVIHTFVGHGDVKYVAISLYSIFLMMAFSFFVHSIASELSTFRRAAWIAGALAVVSAFVVPLEKGRAVGWFKDPNVLGAFLALFLCFHVAAAFADDTGWRRRSFYLIMITLLGAALVYTGSAGALANCGIALLIILVVSVSRSHRKWVFAATVTIGVVGVWAMNAAGLLDRLVPRLMNPEYDMLGLRTRVWQAGLRIWVQHPWGIGPGMFEHNVTLFMDGPDRWVSFSAHSLYVRTLVELGIPGVLFLGAFLLAVASASWSLLHSPEPTAPGAAWRRATVAATVGIATQSLVIDTLHWRHLWILVGVLFAQYRQVQESRPLTPQLLSRPTDGRH